MPDFGFVGAAYEAPSITQDAQECINFYPEIDPTKPQGDRGVIALYPTPGLDTVAIFPNQEEVRGIRSLSGGNYLLAVCGSFAYILESDYNPKMVGQLNTSTGLVDIVDNGIDAYIVDGADRYGWRISDPAAAIFTASISGTTMTVTELFSGTIAVGQQVFGVGVSQETVITALGTGTGGVGTYTVSKSQTAASGRYNSAQINCIFTGSTSGTTLTVSAVSSGTLHAGMTITNSVLTSKTVITALGTGTGGSGTYTISNAQTVPSTAAQFTGQIAGTVLSVTAVSSGTVTNGDYVTGSGVATPTTITAVNTFASTGSSIAVTTGVLTIGTLSSGTISVGQVLTGTGVPAGTRITANISGSGSGSTWNTSITTAVSSTAISGTSYTVTPSQTVTSRAMNSSTGSTMYGLNWTVLPASDGAFVGGSTVEVVDNYFIYNKPDSQLWGATDILSIISNPLSYGTKDGSPDDLVTIIVDRREVYLLGEMSSEVWIDVGAFPFPFQRIPGTSTQQGIGARFSAARVGNSFAYVSKNNRGEATVVRMNGYIPERISTHAVENTLVGQNVSDALAWTYQLNGHETYVVTFPSIGENGLTWAFDNTTGLWHKWLYTNNQNEYERHRGNCCSFFNQQVLVGDYENGKLYRVSLSEYTDDGQLVRRVRRCPHITTDLQRQYFHELQIQFEPGVGLSTGQGNNPQAMLRWSNDGGFTWSNENWVTIGAQGQYYNRAMWRRLGWARDRIFEVVVTDPIKAVIVSANLKATAGDN
jgi:hypothetical protein